MVPQNCSVSLILQNIFLCVQNNHSYRFGNTWGWVDDTIVIFGVNYPFNVFWTKSYKFVRNKSIIKAF